MWCASVMITGGRRGNSLRTIGTQDNNIMKALIAVGVFAILAGIGLLYLSRTGINLTSESQVKTFRHVKSHAKTRIHANVSPIPGWVALGGGLICVGIGVIGMRKKAA